MHFVFRGLELASLSSVWRQTRTAPSGDNSIEGRLDRDASLKAEATALVKSFFGNLGVQTFHDLYNLNELQPIQSYLQEQVNEYNTTASRPASAGALAAIGRIVRTVAEQSHSAHKSASTESLSSQCGVAASYATNTLLAGMLAGQGDPSFLMRVLNSKEVDVRQAN